MDEDERRETAIEATAVLKPDFKSERISQDQINKLKELHKRRLQIKSKIHKNLKGNASAAAKRHENDFNAKHIKDEKSNVAVEDSKFSITKGNSLSLSSPQQDQSPASSGTKKRQKLHWGLDTKERWERKANM